MDSITKPVLCGFCGKEFDYTVYPMIHIPGDHPYGVPELIAGAFVVVMQAWKRNAVVSILTGTVVYMILIRVLV